MKLKTKLRRTRRDRGLTQKELASVFGVTVLTICRWEIGTRAIGVRSRPKVIAWIEGDAK